METSLIKANLLTLIESMERNLDDQHKKLMWDYETKDPYTIRDTQGNFVLMPLVVALANTYAALANLEASK